MEPKTWHTSSPVAEEVSRRRRARLPDDPCLADDAVLQGEDSSLTLAQRSHHLEGLCARSSLARACSAWPSSHPFRSRATRPAKVQE